MKTAFPGVAAGAALALALVGAPAGVQAQYSWLDPGGRKVFSDQPPPLGIDERNVLQRPVPKPAVSAATATSARRPASAAPGAGTDPALAARLKQDDAAAAAREQADRQRIARTQADNCARARQAKATYSSGVALARMDAQGRPVRMDEVTRQTEIERLDGIISSDCR